MAVDQQTERRARTLRRPLRRGAVSSTGAMLFPDLVWKHFRWRNAVMASDGVGPGTQPTETNGGKSGRVAPHDVRELKRSYLKALGRFQRAEGKIVDAYWCSRDASAVAVTEKHGGWFLRPNLRMRVHRVSDWITSDVPKVAMLLHEYDALALRASEILTPAPKRIALEWIFAEESYLLGFVERTGGQASEQELEDLVRDHHKSLTQVEDYYERAGAKAARIYYFLGMILGTLLLFALGTAVVIPLIHWVGLKPFEPSAQNFFASYAAGAIGAVVSVMTRMRSDKKDERGFRIDYEVGRQPLYVLGAFRPFIGAVFGTAVYFALQSSFVQLKPTNMDSAFYFFALVAFLAGFSERFTHVILGQAEGAVTGAKGATKEGEGRDGGS